MTLAEKRKKKNYNLLLHHSLLQLFAPSWGLLLLFEYIIRAEVFRQDGGKCIQRKVAGRIQPKEAPQGKVRITDSYTATYSEGVSTDAGKKKVHVTLSWNRNAR